MLQKYSEGETLKMGMKNHTWLGHCEGRHHMFSGMHFLLALQAEPARVVAVAKKGGICLTSGTQRWWLDPTFRRMLDSAALRMGHAGGLHRGVADSG